MLQVEVDPEDFEPTRWWQIWLPGAGGNTSLWTLWMETSDREEVKREKIKLEADNRPHRIQHLYSVTIKEWREEQL